MEEDTTYEHISLIFGSSIDTGKLRLLPGSLIWRQADDAAGATGRISLKLETSNITKVTYTHLPQNFRFNIHMKDGNIYTFSGFKKMDQYKVKSFFRNHAKQAQQETLSTTAQNWGNIHMTGHNLTMMTHDDKETVFHYPLHNVSNVKVSEKNEVTLELQPDDLMTAREIDTLHEMIFHIPNTDPVFGMEEGLDPAQAFKNKIDSKEGVLYSEDDGAVAEFHSVKVLHMTGVSSLNMHLKYLNLVNSDKELKISYHHITSVTLLDKETPIVIIGINPAALTTKDTILPHIMIQFQNKEEVHKKLCVSEKLFDEKLKDKVDRSYKGVIHDVFVRILGDIASVVPCVGDNCVELSFENKHGELYLLDDRMLFVPNPSIEIRLDEVSAMEFVRGDGYVVELIVELKTQGKFVFNGIQRQGYNKLESYMKSKVLRNLNLEKLEEKLEQKAKQDRRTRKI